MYAPFFFLPKPRVSLFLILFAFSLWYLYAHGALRMKKKKQRTNDLRIMYGWLRMHALPLTVCLKQWKRACKSPFLLLISVLVGLALNCTLQFHFHIIIILILPSFFPFFLHSLRSFYGFLLVNSIFAISRLIPCYGIKWNVLLNGRTTNIKQRIHSHNWSDEHL